MITFDDLYPGRFIKWKKDGSIGIVISKFTNEDRKTIVKIRWSDNMNENYDYDADDLKGLNEDDDIELLDSDVNNYPEQDEVLIMHGAIVKVNGVDVGVVTKAQTDGEFLESLGLKYKEFLESLGLK